MKNLKEKISSIISSNTDGQVKYVDALDSADDILKLFNDFENMSKIVLQYVNDNHHPHITILATTTSLEVLEGVKSTGHVYDFVKY